MKNIFLLSLSLFSTVIFASAQSTPGTDGQPSEIVVTPYKTTMLCRDKVLIIISVIDKQGKTLHNVNKPIHFKVTGMGAIMSTYNGDAKRIGGAITESEMHSGRLEVTLLSGLMKGLVKFEASGDGLITGETEIQVVQPGTPHPVTLDKPIAGDAVITEKIIGADISYLPQLEDRGIKFSGKDGKPGDAIQILKDHGFNYIRLRLFNHPETKEGYSPGKAYCDLAQTMKMAKRIKAAGMKFLLDFHYSDYWADPQHQITPAGWSKLDFNSLKDSVYQYTKYVMQTLKNQGTAPDMVQVGNEINHGMIWPDGAINNLDSLANLIYAGVRGVKEVNPSTAIMLHIALGGQNEEARWFLDNMLKRKVPFDVIGLSYYPKWHGTLSDLKNNMSDLAKRYHKYVMVAEYSQLKKEVNDIAFTAPKDKALGTFIWEPLNTWEQVFDRSGRANAYLDVYPGIDAKYNVH
jgi:beta-galactosidase